MRTAVALMEKTAVGSDLVTGAEWSPPTIRQLYQLASDVKAVPERYRAALGGRSIVMIFEKPSLRTRVTFEVGSRSLGGTAIFQDQGQSRLGERESIKDVAKNLECWVHAIVARTFDHAALEKLAEHAAIPVIN